MKLPVLLTLLACMALPAFSQVELKVMQQGVYVSLDTLNITIDENDNTGTNDGVKVVYMNIYNLSTTHSEAFYLEAEWICSNSSVKYQFCQEYPPDYLSGTCETFHSAGVRAYDDYNYSIPPDTCSYNYLQCYLKIYNYSVEAAHQKICRFTVKRKITHEVLDVMYLNVRRGNMPCGNSLIDTNGTTGITTLSLDDVAEIYPNPARSFVTIAAKQGGLTGCSLYSPVGKLVFDRKIAHGQRLDVPTGGLSNGVYYLKLIDNSGKAFYKKIVVDH